MPDTEDVPRNDEGDTTVSPARRNKVAKGIGHGTTEMAEIKTSRVAFEKVPDGGRNFLADGRLKMFIYISKTEVFAIKDVPTIPAGRTVMPVILGNAFCITSADGPAPGLDGRLGHTEMDALGRQNGKIIKRNGTTMWRKRQYTLHQKPDIAREGEHSVRFMFCQSVSINTSSSFIGWRLRYQQQHGFNDYSRN